jgi:hypothetical protein
MRATAPAAHQLPPQVVDVQPPRTVADAVKQMHDSNAYMAACIARLERLASLDEQPPEMATVVINEGNNGQYIVPVRSHWEAKGIGFLNPGSANVFVGIGGVSARPLGRAPQVPGGGALVLPLRAKDFEIGCDPAVLLANTAVVYVFRYVFVPQFQVIGNL